MTLTMNATTKLVKAFHTGTISVWEFGQLSNGKYAASNTDGARKVFKDEKEMTKLISAYKSYGYFVPTTQIVEALAALV